MITVNIIEYTDTEMMKDLLLEISKKKLFAKELDFSEGDSYMIITSDIPITKRDAKLAAIAEGYPKEVIK